MMSSRAATRRGCAHAARQRHEDQRGAEAGEPPRRSRDEGNDADGDGGIDGYIGRDEANEAHPRNVPPVFLLTSATIFAATASISWSVRVFSRGCSVTAMAIDFLPSPMPLPSSPSNPV